jgi:hypothetical protein
LARCPHCDKVLSDDWIRENGASLLGRAGGRAKARNAEQARAAAQARWTKAKKAGKKRPYRKIEDSIQKKKRSS